MYNNVYDHSLFSSFMTTYVVGSPSYDIKLLILGTLRYIGHACTFDNLEEATSISRKLHRRFYHAFIEYGTSILFKRHVIQCTTHESASVLIRVQLILKASIDDRDNSWVFENPIYYCLVSCGVLS